MSRRSSPLIAAVLAGVLPFSTLTSSVHAEDKALAESLFKQGKELMDAGNVAEACPKLAASLRADRADGTMLRLALCYQQLGKWASAWALYKEALPRAEKAGRKDRVDMAKKGVEDTEPKLSRVTIDIKALARIPGMEVKWDDTVLEEGAWGTPLVTDPGGHTLSIKAAGKKPYTQHVEINGGTSDNKTILVEQLENETAAPPPTVPDKGVDNGQKVRGFVGIGVGVVLGGLAVGARFAVSSTNDTHFATCAQQLSATCNDPDGVSKVRMWEGVSFAAGGLALVSLGLGVYWVVTAPSSSNKSSATLTLAPSVGASHQMVVLSGKF